MKIDKKLALICLLAAMCTSVYAQDKTDLDVKDNGKQLVQGVDYDLTYENNIEAGTATVIVNFKGNYKGQLKRDFKIVKSKHSGGSGGGGSAYAVKTTPKPTILPTKQPTESILHTAYVSGYGDGQFMPDKKITRAETASMLNQLLTVAEKNEPLTFSDMVKGGWYVDAVNNMSRAGIINGYTDGTFRPDNNITRAEFVTMVMQNEVVSECKEIPFVDITEDSWYSNYVYSAYKAGYINGYVDGTFKPDNPITRAEAVTILNKSLGRDTSKVSKLANPFEDVKENHWAYKQVLEAAVTHEHMKGETQ